MNVSSSRKITYADAILEALDQSMTADERVIVIGEGVPDPKAIFGTTKNLQSKYGCNRVFDMPLSENGVTGICIGAALSDLRPVMIHQRIDFALLSMDQLINNAAKWHYMFNGESSVPIVVRMIMGRGWGQGPQHSQGLHNLFAQVPGLKVIMPSTPFDAKGLLIGAISDPNPVVFIEHRWLHSITDYVPFDMYQLPIGVARILKEGSSNSLTIASVSYASMEALSVARGFSEYLGVDIEVIDLRTIRPLDFKTVSNSVKKTGRLLIVDTAFEGGSISGELAFRVGCDAFAELKVAPQRICMPDYPVPTSHYLSDGYYPGPIEIADAVLTMLDMNELDEAKRKLLYEKITPINKHDTPSMNFVGPF